jgi:hypothetical protein
MVTGVVTTERGVGKWLRRHGWWINAAGVTDASHDFLDGGPVRAASVPHV